MKIAELEQSAQRNELALRRVFEPKRRVKTCEFFRLAIAARIY